MEKVQHSQKMLRALLKAQKSEITEHHIYSRLGKTIKDSKNSDVLKTIAKDEKRHYEFWKHHTGRDVKPSRWKVLKFYWISRIFGLTFGIKLMERGEEKAHENYMLLVEEIPGARTIAEDEDAHEKKLIDMIEEERLNYMGSVVLGLNDALVELTGALAGLTFALQNTRLIALAGLITGIAAAFSMAASEYLSTKSEDTAKNALTSSIYTGIAYFFTVFFLILPYLLVSHYMVCLALTLLIAIAIIFFFNYYISVAKDLSFKKRFFEMAAISLGVAGISFGVGFLIRTFIGVEL